MSRRLNRIGNRGNRIRTNRKPNASRPASRPPQWGDKRKYGLRNGEVPSDWSGGARIRKIVNTGENKIESKYNADGTQKIRWQDKQDPWNDNNKKKKLFPVQRVNQKRTRR